MFKGRSSSDDEYESQPLHRDLRAQEQVKPWDVFKDPPNKVVVGSMVQYKWLDSSVKILKIVTFLLTFLVVLVCGIISKGTLLFMTSQIAPDQSKPYCNNKLGTSQQFVVYLPISERVAWMWILIFVYWVPEAFTFLRSFRILCFKTWEPPTKYEFLSLMITESLPAIGSAILAFCILPELDVIKGAMITNAVCFVPAVVGFISRKPKTKSILPIILDILSILAQASVFIVWPIVEGKAILWLILPSVLFISVGWWENYVSESSPIQFISDLGRIKKKFENSRYYMYAIVSVWKAALFFVSVIVIIWIREGNKVEFLFTKFTEAFAQHDINITEITPVIINGNNQPNFADVIQGGTGTTVPSNYNAPIWVFIINFLATYICYAFAKFTCKIMIQVFSYAFPINLVVPATISILIAVCGSFANNECVFEGIIPEYLFFNYPSIHYLEEFIAKEFTWIWLLWLLSQAWITIHLWAPKNKRLAKTEKLYVRPMYDAYLIDQCLGLNRRRDETPPKLDDDEDIGYNDYDDPITMRSSVDGTDYEDRMTRIYACGTMWHETKEEMMEFLQSIMRLDEDQCARRIVKDYFQVPLRDYYELETHVFFDDAFIRKNEDDNDPQVNEFVKILVTAMDDAASEVHETYIRVRPPTKYITPYGGRLEWILPGKTKMIAHLKDAMKIRRKKRWSQVMYMYYLLGHRLMEREDLSQNRKQLRAENTFILALDGDIDFQPHAVQLLVDLMENKTLGAACGRIHPIGSGPMVWYQMFEYAIGHWLQKATEHMIGCVLCSPGCFSLFRGSALMDDGVMRKYTTRSEEARHYVQYDQGEDRWLCTLLLQRGYRVEYSAASDAYTHCPEGFNEFYNQRRRWMPSTTANIFDLLMDYKRTIQINDNISRFYILYQVILMVGTILGPGTIFLMLVGAFVAAFQLDQWSSFFWNVVPIMIFMVVCFFFKSEVQLVFAGIISAIYGLVMMAVVVGVMLQITNDGPLAPSSLFFFFVGGEMIITAILHPKEFNCLVYGLVYYVTVPSMYMLLVIYSVFNMNNVSWGTREVTVIYEKKEPPTKKDIEKAKETAKHNTILSFLGATDNENAGTFEFSLGNLFKLMCCTHRKDGEEKIQLMHITDTLDKLSRKLDTIEKLALIDNPEEPVAASRRRTTIIEGSRAMEVTEEANDNMSIETESIISSDGIDPHSWLYEQELQHGEVECITSREKTFWEAVLDKYLHPIDDKKDPAKKAKLEQDLKDLRDKAVLAFFMCNSLFVLVIFLLTLKKEFLHLDWPLDVKYNFTYIDTADEIHVSSKHLELEPIGLVFVFFFAILLVVQFFAMLLHRFSTFSQIMANTTIDWFVRNKNAKNLTEDEILERDALTIAKQLMQIKGAEDEEEAKQEQTVGRRKTVHNLLRFGQKVQTVNDLDTAFERRLTRFRNNSYKGPVRRPTLATINRRLTQSQIKFNIPNDSFSTGGGYSNPVFEDNDETHA